MNFKEEIKTYNFQNAPYIIKMGLNDIAIIVKENNPIETSTKIIAKYVSNETESSFLININEDLEENFNNLLLNIINTQKKQIITTKKWLLSHIFCKFGELFVLKFKIIVWIDFQSIFFKSEVKMSAKIFFSSSRITCITYFLSSLYLVTLFDLCTVCK